MSLRALALATALLHASIAFAQHLIANQSAVVLATIIYYPAAAALVACYAVVIRSVDETPSRMTWRVIVGVPLLIQIGWVLSLPALSIDPYSYLVDAAHAHAGLNPYEHPVREAGGTEFGHELATYGWRPSHGVSPYGPLWMHLISIVGPFTGEVAVAVRIVKLLAFSATALTAWLLFRGASASFRVRSFTVFWWNPVVIIEGAGEGHNDVVMVAALALSLWCLRRNALVGSAAALTAAVLIKWTPAFFGPAYVAYSCRNGLLTRRSTVVAGAVVAAVTIAAYWPWWAGTSTFAGVWNAARPRFAASMAGSLVRVLADYPTAQTFLRVCAASALAAVVIYTAAITRTKRDLVCACAAIALAYVLLAAPAYWPWYVLMPIALLTLVDDIPLILVLTLTSRLVAPLNVMRIRSGFSLATEVWLTTVIALWVPLAYIAWRWVTTPMHQPRSGDRRCNPGPLPPFR